MTKYICIFIPLNVNLLILSFSGKHYMTFKNIMFSQIICNCYTHTHTYIYMYFFSCTQIPFYDYLLTWQARYLSLHYNWKITRRTHSCSLFLVISQGQILIIWNSSKAFSWRYIDNAVKHRIHLKWANHKIIPRWNECYKNGMVILILSQA